MQWKLSPILKSQIKNLYHTLPNNFDYKIYLLLYPDLKEAGITTEEEAIEHFILFGRKEHRIYYNSNPELNNIVVDNKKEFHNTIYKTKNINSIFDKIYVISLKNNDSLMKNYFEKFDIKYKTVRAMDGSKNKKVIDIYNDYLSWKKEDPRRHRLDHSDKKRLILGPGAIGLLLTYKNIFKEAIKNKYKYILIFEDDCLLDKDINLHINNFFKFKQDFDLLFLGASHHVWNNPSEITVPNSDTKYYKAPHILDGTFAIAYNCNILPQLLESMSTVNSPIDSGPIRDILKHDNSYVITPNCVVADTTPKSSISGISRNLRSHKLKMRWDLRNIDFTRGIIKTSIIAANYNNEETIKRSIESVLNQTYQNFELIIIDDNSTDNSVKIIKSYCKKDKRIKLIELNKNVGAYACRNIGLNNSNGFFITLLDCDDIFLSQKIEQDIYNYFNLQQYNIFFSNMYRCQNINLNKFKTDKTILRAIERERVPYIQNNTSNTIYGHNTKWDYKFRFGLPTIFTDKLFFDEYGPWNEKHRYGMDIELIQKYIVKKYNEFISHDQLWEKIYLYQADKYGIYLSPTINYISFPQNENNATNLCSGNNRQKIHSTCNKLLKKQIMKSQKKYNTSEIFCMVKNEEDIIQYFLDYHINIVDSITLIDNGSSDKTLEIAKKYPIKIIENSSSFSEKALIISNLMQNSYYDILIPLDIDEFLILDKDNKKRANQKLIKKYISELDTNISKFQIKTIYEYHPSKIGYWDITDHTKMIFSKKHFLAVDVGHHHGTTKNDSLKKIDLSYCHFHFRSKQAWIKKTQQKLKTRLGNKWNDLDALRQYRGDSSHCVNEWLSYMTTGEWHNLQPKVKFKFNNNMTFD